MFDPDQSGYFVTPRARGAHSEPIARRAACTPAPLRNPPPKVACPAFQTNLKAFFKQKHTSLRIWKTRCRPFVCPSFSVGYFASCAHLRPTLGTDGHLRIVMQQPKFRHVCPSETSGYLIKAKKFPPSRRKFFYRLNGAVLTRHHSEDSLCREKIVVVGAVCKTHSHNGLIMTLNHTHYVFYARNEIECNMWIDALNEASKFRLERFYDIRQVIGVGGFAEVRVAYDLETEAKVAVKTIKKSGQTDAFLQRELNIMRKLNHPHVVRTFDIFESGNKYHIVMEYLSGGSLFDAMTPHTRFHEADVRMLMRQVLNGLAYIHSRDVVHRDLKPENILLAGGKPPHHAKIADFGLSKFHDAGTDELMKTMIGTPQFVAPELVKNEAYGSEVDAWACGIIIYNMLTGEIPFSENEVLDKYRTGNFKIEYHRNEWKHVSSKAKNLTRKLLCIDPSRRLSAIGALHHNWFVDAEEDYGAGYIQNNNQSKLRGLRSKDGRPFNSLSKTNLQKVRVFVHAIRFLQRILAKAGNERFFKAEEVELSDFIKYHSRTSVGTTEDSEWDFVVRDVSIGHMDYVPTSPSTSPRNAKRKQNIADRQSTTSMISLITPQAGGSSSHVIDAEALNISSSVSNPANRPEHVVDSSISKSNYGDRQRVSTSKRTTHINRVHSSSSSGSSGNVQIYRSNTAGGPSSAFKDRHLNCASNDNRVRSGTENETNQAIRSVQSGLPMSSEIRLSESPEIEPLTPSVLPLNEENMWESADPPYRGSRQNSDAAYDHGRSATMSRHTTYSGSEAMSSKDERAVEDTRPWRRPRMKEMKRRLLDGLRIGRKNRDRQSEHSP